MCALVSSPIGLLQFFQFVETSLPFSNFRLALLFVIVLTLEARLNSACQSFAFALLRSNFDSFALRHLVFRWPNPIEINHYNQV